MTAYEIISLFIAIISLMIAFGSLLITFLVFLDRKNKKNIFIYYRIGRIKIWQKD